MRTKRVEEQQSPAAVKLSDAERAMLRRGIGFVRGKFEDLVRGEKWAALREAWQAEIDSIDNCLVMKIDEAKPSFDAHERLILRAAVDAFVMHERSCLPALRGIGKEDFASELEDEAETWTSDTRPKFQEQIELEFTDADVGLVK